MTREAMRAMANAPTPTDPEDMRMTIHGLRSVAHQLLDETEWRPIETSPKGGTRDEEWSLGWTTEYGYVVFRWDWWCYVDRHGMEVCPTHYKPSLAPPEPQTQGTPGRAEEGE